MAAPVLETPRLVMRPHRLEDFPDLARTWADPEVVRHITGIPSTEQQSWMRMLNYAGLWATLGFGYWALEDRATAAYVGDVGFADFRREIDGNATGVPEMGWVLSPRFHGRGYASEAVRAALGWGDRHLRSNRTTCIVSPDNGPSLRVAAKAGYAEYARADLNGPVVLFERFSGGP
jgi:RimJ/RimL family protein N-acetyltransferase